MAAYNELYLPEAQRKLAIMIDLFVNTLGYSLTDAWQLFLQSQLSHKFETGDCSVVAGRSGTEMVMDIFWEKGIEMKIDPPILLELSEEYWTGWALAYYQWESGLTFAEIEKKVPIEMIRAMYMPYHEMDIKHFKERMDQLCKK